jgi:hypothetical protein
MVRKPRSAQLETCGWLLAAAVLLAAGACRKAPQPAAAAPSGAPEATAAAPPEAAAPATPAEPEPESLGEAGAEIRFGLALAADGSVEQPVLTFGRDDRVCFSVSMPADSPGGQLTARWYDVEGRQLGEVAGSLAGSPPHAGLCLPEAARLALGPYQLELEVDGQAAGEASFTVAGARELAARGSGA